MSDPKTIRINCTGAELLPIEFLNELQGGLKELSKPNEAKLRKNILELGFSEPVTIWKKGEKYYIVNGHQRVKVLGNMAAEGYDIPKIPANIVEAKDEAEAKRLVLSLTSQFGEITEEGMLAFANEAGLALKDIDESFVFPELDVGKLVLKEEDKPEKDDDVPETAPEAIAKRGEIYQLGNHRLMCGDATVAEDVNSLMKDGKANMIFTDPPYGIEYSGGTRAREKVSNDSVTGLYEFLLKSFKHQMENIVDGGPVYVCHADMNRLQFLRAFMEAGFKHASILIWAKNNSAFGRQDYHWKHEPMLYGWREGKAHEWHGDNKQDTVWLMDRPSASIKHPTMKPVELPERAIINSSPTGAVVMDVFGGSGSTMIACEKTKRQCMMIELDPVYVDVIIKRWEEYTSKKAEKISG